MNLLSVKELEEKAGVKKSAISRAVKSGNVKYYRDGNTKPKQIDADDPVNKAYIQSMNPARMSVAMDDITESMVTVLQPGEDELSELAESVKDDLAKLAKYKAEKEKESVKKLKIQNKHLDAQYLEKDVIYNGVILYIDSFHSAIDRYFGTVIDDLAVRILSAGEVTPEIFQTSIDEGHKIIDDYKNQMLVKINQIVKDIENKK